MVQRMKQVVKLPRRQRILILGNKIFILTFCSALPNVLALFLWRKIFKVELQARRAT